MGVSGTIFFEYIWKNARIHVPLYPEITDLAYTNPQTTTTMKVKDITCNSPIEAEGFRSVLLEAGIESSIYDETNSKVARGILDQRTDVLMKEEDYEKAMSIYQTYMAEQQAVKPWCPECGSENVARYKKSYATARQLPRILATLLASFPLFGTCTTQRYVCNNCGHEWER